MQTQDVRVGTVSWLFASRLKDYAALGKLRLASLVVFSAAIGYFIAPGEIDPVAFAALMVGGFLVTGSSNAINQIIERNLDKLMNRTMDRPLPAARITAAEAIVVAALMGISGVWTLFYFLNPLSGWLGLLALVLYTALYTPLKRITPLAVMVGAIPGAIPPMLGYVAMTGSFDLVPGLLFLFQFMWQFPHFWAIAWKLHEDYSRAGFKLLPSPGGRDRASAFQTVVYALFLIPVSLLFTLFGITGYLSAVVALAMGLWYLWKSYRLYVTCGDREATQLMFASFIYLPVVLIAYMLDKV